MKWLFCALLWYSFVILPLAVLAGRFLARDSPHPQPTSGDSSTGLQIAGTAIPRERRTA